MGAGPSSPSPLQNAAWFVYGASSASFTAGCRCSCCTLPPTVAAAPQGPCLLRPAQKRAASAGLMRRSLSLALPHPNRGHMSPHRCSGLSPVWGTVKNTNQFYNSSNVAVAKSRAESCGTLQLTGAMDSDWDLEARKEQNKLSADLQMAGLCRVEISRGWDTVSEAVDRS
ncbi:hypothetical protein NDU88_009354 [Pleurodeles waltl]|uniref:Uncharacterized protein n=1 Tax=Pleurodeles waltl TaxID=8319 RepID=A0AAV7PS80_PLEWA|nr:hypothetical protein NDU88_009354 [Pleurodeles waltl]